VSKSETICDIYVTPSDMLNSIRNLLDWEEGADVKFKVKGERFSIPTRYGFSRVCSISSTIKDLLPTMDYVDGDEKEEMVKHFLVAADRYAMERVKVMCSHFRTS
jgi:speckle-type POZ protein